MYQANDMVTMVLNDGLRIYKYKNSKIKPAGTAEENKGAVFGYRSKEHMIQGRGMVITSEEAAIENGDQLTHWTPNVYRFGTYADKSRQFTKGHSEENLRQINTFVVDIDVTGEKFSHGEIVLAAFDRIGLLPTLIVDTPGGYQAYFALEKAVYVTKKSNFKVINVAKRISENIRKELAKELPGVDLGCNHFGIARIPRSDNVLFFEESYRYSFQEWISWSMKKSGDKPGVVIPFPTAKKNEIRQVDEKWFDLLLHSEKLKGSKGLLGRNNAVFTLSLAYYSSGYDKATCEYNMIMLNERFSNPLRESEILRVVKSAYSGEYQAASKDFVREICHAWVSPNLTDDQLFSNKAGWWKFKKDRKDRVKSHSKEWQQDILHYLNEQSYTYKPFVYSTKKEIREEIGVPERSFDAALKKLKESNQVFYRVTRGRGGGIMIASVKALMRTIILTKKEVREAYFQAIREAFSVAGTLVQEIFEQLLPMGNGYTQIELLKAAPG
ncbi:primase C-terminal domain-containing protein [Enterococcus sp. AZ072]|uniref:primase C-terminal domain-containing protein n=1 Tax=unclassified Enterococcus TaxID=2608891 RepID=UPI003D2D989B